MTTHQAIYVHLSTHNPSFQGLLGGERSGIRPQHNYWGILTYPIDELPTQTVMLYHKADWKDINQTITNTMTNHTLYIHTSTIQDNTSNSGPGQRKTPTKMILATDKTITLQDQLQLTGQNYQTIHSTNATKQLDKILQRCGTFRRA